MVGGSLISYSKQGPIPWAATGESMRKGDKVFAVLVVILSITLIAEIVVLSLYLSV